MHLPFSNTYARLPERFFEKVHPTPVAAPKLLFWNEALAQALGLAPRPNDDANFNAELAVIFAGNKVPPGAEPLAQAYAGHQFGHFVPQLGDGRAILLGEVLTPSGLRYDLQLKGAGPTKFSRRGDGRAGLGPMIREVILGEAMHALGIPTTRALALVASGEPVMRETPLPGAVLTRVAASHVRVGTFQYFAARGDNEALATLVDFTLKRHFPSAASSGSMALDLLIAAIHSQAKLIAQWLQVGFIHGVMNTDNMALSGETIDYGPCAFLDIFDPSAVFSSIDRDGRYAYQQQPSIALWNLGRLAECLLPLIDPSPERTLERAQAELDRFAPLFQQAHLEGFGHKLGLTKLEARDATLVGSWLALMQNAQADFTLSFDALAEATTPQGEAALRALMPSASALDDWLSAWRERLAAQREAPETLIERLRAANPQIIPRNHQIEKAIIAAQNEGNLQPFNELLRVVRQPYHLSRPEDAAYRNPPQPSEVVRATFCGT
jgi:uncharacterized protein YdiU (UPF0061 family)